MADQLLQQAQDLFEGQIVCSAFPNGIVFADQSYQDFEGQRLTELLSTVILTVTGVRVPPNVISLL